MRKVIHLSLAVAMMLSVATGCGSRRETVRTTTVTRPVETVEGEPEVVERTTTETTEDSHHGVIGTTFEFIGEVITFPFRLVGAVFSTLF